jgi:hypothetical protein
MPSFRGPEPFRPSARKSGHHAISKSHASFFQAWKLRRSGMVDSENDHRYSNPEHRFRSDPAGPRRKNLAWELLFDQA